MSGIGTRTNNTTRVKHGEPSSKFKIKSHQKGLSKEIIPLGIMFNFQLILSRKKDVRYIETKISNIATNQLTLLNDK